MPQLSTCYKMHASSGNQGRMLFFGSMQMYADLTHSLKLIQLIDSDFFNRGQLMSLSFLLFLVVNLWELFGTMTEQYRLNRSPHSDLY